MTPATSDALIAFALDEPRPGGGEHGHTLMFDGWVLGRERRVVALQITAAFCEPRRLPVNIDRPEVGAAHPEVRWAGRSGFRGAISTVSLPRDFLLSVSAVFGDETQAFMATISGRRADLVTAGELSAATPGELAPLALTTLARTGSTWVTGLLGAHPAILAPQPFRFEPRAGAFWMDVLATLAEPQSYHQMVAPDAYGHHWWTGERRMIPQARFEAGDRLGRWLDTEYVEDIATFARRQVDSFYRHAAEPGDLRTASFFLEKSWPGPSTRMLRALYPRMREVFLVRDFRDVACSIFAYNRRRGFESFGRRGVATDRDYIAGPLLQFARGLLDAWRAEAGTAFLLRYEDLVRDPHPTLERVFSHLGLDWDDDLVERAVRGAEHSEGLGDHQTAASLEATVGRWREDLGEAEQEAFEGEWAEVLADFGYPGAVSDGA